ncbi:MAG: ABC transporter permease subunit [Candidatus Aenigmarchaeota archaeon]|nr:ABC transporter permease subunit [Candidatus Aenigmarchaeota archaeon]
MKKSTKRYLVGFIIGLVLLILSYTYVMTNVKNPEIGNLPYYTFRSLLRITTAYILSLVFGLSFGILASMNKRFSSIITPTFDILQSIPILGYFPVAIMIFIAIFPSAIGLELASIFLLFTSMVWAIFFGVFDAAKSIPVNILDAAKSFNIKGFQFIRHVMIPAIMPAIISGSFLAWCDGWFFMIAAEYISYAGQVRSLPGLGSFLAKSTYVYNDVNLSIIILIVVTFLVIFINYLTWHRLTEKVSSYMPLIKLGFFTIPHDKKIKKRRFTLQFKFRHHILSKSKRRIYTSYQRIISIIIVIIIFILVIFSIKVPTLEDIKKSIFIPEISKLPIYTFFTLSRLTIAYIIALAIAIFMGILAAEKKKFAMIFYPLYDIGQAIPVLALFPILFVCLSQTFGGRLGLEITAITMLVLDMIWYMFLNIAIAVKSIPEEMREVSKIFGFKGMKRIKHIILPAIVPAIVTGSILAWGTGWNTIIFSEYMPYGKEVLSIPGLGSFLDKVGYEEGNTIMLIFILSIISSIVILMEWFVWRKLLKKTEKYELET